MNLWRQNDLPQDPDYEDEMTHIDLFSGISGFAYAALRVWGDEYENVLFCDSNKFCQEVIKKNFGKESLIYGDIKELTFSRKGDIETPANLPDMQGDRKFKRDRGSSFGLCEAVRDTMAMPALPSQMAQRTYCERIVLNERPFLLTAGIPCQPASCAGKRRGTQDDRWLWPEAFRIIRETQSRFVILENVRGILTLESGLVFQSLLTEMENLGYEVRAYIIPACAVNAPHRRDRVWIVANRKNWRKRGGEQERYNERKQKKKIGGSHRDACNSASKRLARICQSKQPQRLQNVERTDWERNWKEVAFATCDVRVDDGLPAELDEFKLTKAQHRVERLKALGNAIIPQVAIEIMKAIKYADDHHS